MGANFLKSIWFEVRMDKGDEALLIISEELPALKAAWCKAGDQNKA